MIPPTPTSTIFPYTTLFRSDLQITRETLDYGLKGFIDETGIVTTQNMGATISDDNPETINSHVAQKYLDTSDYKKIGKSVIDHTRAELFKAVSENNPNETSLYINITRWLFLINVNTCTL